VEATGGSRNLNNKERHDWFPSVIIKAINLRRMRLEERAGKGGEQRNRGQRAADTVRWPDSGL